MKGEGIVFMTYKTLYYELAERVDTAQEQTSLPDDLRDSAV
jgi:hypothetical protein